MRRESGGVNWCRRTRGARGARRTEACAALLVVALSGACRLPPPESTLGEEGQVGFRSPQGLEVFSGRVIVGAEVTITAVAVDSDDSAAVATGELVSTDPAVVEVLEAGAAGGRVRFVGPGEASLELRLDGEALDRITLRAAHPVLIEVTDHELSSTTIDPALPYEVGVVERTRLTVGARATDLCGGRLVVADALSLRSADPSVLATSDGTEAGTWDLEGLAPGATELLFDVGDAGVAAHVAFVVEEREVDGVYLDPVAWDGQQGRIWSRAFAGNLECVGVDHDWRAGDAVILGATDGQLVDAMLTNEAMAILADGGTLDGDDEISDEVYDVEERATLSTLGAVNSDPRRVEAYVPPSSGSWCDPDAGACDPYIGAAAGVVIAWAPRRRRRRSA